MNTTIAVAMSGGVDSSTAAAMLAHAGDAQRSSVSPCSSGIRRGWPASMAFPTRPRQAAAARSTTCTTRAAWPSTWDSLLRGQPGRALRARRGAAVCGRVSGRAHAHSLLALQQPSQVRPVAADGALIGASRIATGHYAVNEYDAKRGRWILKRPADLAKDQTYFLFGLTQEQLGAHPVSAGRA